MFNALVRKEILQLIYPVIRNPKNGEKRSKGFVLLVVLMALFIGISVSFARFGFAIPFFAAFESGDAEVAFSAFTFISFAVALVLSDLILYSSLYMSGDNDLLMSMPIRPVYILTSRLVPTLIFNFAYCFFSMLPVYLISSSYMSFSLKVLLLSVPVMFLTTFFSTTVATFMVFAIGALTARMKSKNTVQVFLTVFLSAVYTIGLNVAIRINDRIFQYVMKMKDLFNSYLYFFGLLGKAAVGDTYSLFIAFVISVALFTFIFILLNTTFFSLVNAKPKEKKLEYDSGMVKESGINRALFRLEHLRFRKTPVFFMNNGIGTIMMSVSAVAVFIFRKSIIPVLDYLDSFSFAGAIMMLIIMNCQTTAFVSIEGQTNYLLKSLPVSVKKVLNAKIKVNLLYTLLPLSLLHVSIWFSLPFPMEEKILLIMFSFIFTFFISGLGLINDLRYGNINWVNETMAVKNNPSSVHTVLETLFPSMAVLGLSFVLHISSVISISVLTAITVVLNVIVFKDIRENGERLYLEM